MTEPRKLNWLPVSALWAVNLTVLAVLVLWCYGDAEFGSLVTYTLERFGLPTAGAMPIQTGDLTLELRRAILIGTAVIAGLSWLALIVAAIIGPKTYRSFLAWWIVVTLSALWMLGAVNWQGIARTGKVHRLRRNVAAFEAIAKPLRTSWPKADGHTDELGPFMAYPVGRPSVLILLTLPLPSEIRPSVSVVERGDHGQLLFQLAGRERGHWLEWHPKGSSPKSFIGGLLDEFQLERSDPVSDGWYLTKYRNVGPMRR